MDLDPSSSKMGGFCSVLGEKMSSWYLGCCKDSAWSIRSCSSLLFPGRSGCVGRGRSQDSSVGVSVPKVFTAVYSLAYPSMVTEGVSVNQKRLRSHLGVIALGCQ